MPYISIAGMYELYEQLLPTKLYTKEKTQTSTDGEVLCRLFGKVAESVAHALAGCSSLAQTRYLYRHDAALKILGFLAPARAWVNNTRGSTMVLIDDAKTNLPEHHV